MESIVYGAKELSMREVGELVERALDISLTPHDSSFYTDDYLSATTELDEAITVVNNRAVDEAGEVQRPEFPDRATILDIEETERGDFFVEKLGQVPGLELLKRSPW